MQSLPALAAAQPCLCSAMRVITNPRTVFETAEAYHADLYACKKICPVVPREYGTPAENGCCSAMDAAEIRIAIRRAILWHRHVSDSPSDVLPVKTWTPF